MSMFRKKPVVIEARQLTDATLIDIVQWLNEESDGNFGYHAGPSSIQLNIPTLEGVMVASRGDWIIRGVAGEFYPCKPDIFEQTYEPVPGGAS